MLQSGQIIQNRYQLLEVLGQNASRQTWLAKDQDIDDRTSADVVVIKLLVCGDQVQWDDLKLFEREAHTLQQLDHPQIPKYLDYFPIEECLLWFGLVREYIPGQSLKEVLENGLPFTEADIRQLAKDLLQILCYLHELSPPVLHRDLKPSNIMMGEDHQIHLIDFGSVQNRAAKSGATFTVVGTYGYAPLEQFGGQATAASDLYALGATLIHLVTGMAPIDLLQQDARLQFAHLVEINPGLARWLEKMTAPNASDRFQSARQALQALEFNEASSSAIASPQKTGRMVILKSPKQLSVEVLADLKNTSLITQLLGSGIGLSFFGWMIVSKILWNHQYNIKFPNQPPILWWEDTQTNLGVFFVGLLTSVLWISPTFVKTKVELNSQFMIIEWWLLGIRLQKKQVRIIDISAVQFQRLKNQHGKNNGAAVVVSTETQEYIISRREPFFTPTECKLLSTELQSWLGLDFK